MKKIEKKSLTKRAESATLRRMPTENATSNGLKTVRPFKAKKPSAADQYGTFFIPMPSPAWQYEDDHYSLDQPSPYRWVQTETTYGFDITLLCPPANA